MEAVDPGVVISPHCPVAPPEQDLPLLGTPWPSVGNESTSEEGSQRPRLPRPLPSLHRPASHAQARTCSSSSPRNSAVSELLWGGEVALSQPGLGNFPPPPVPCRTPGPQGFHSPSQVGPPWVARVHAHQSTFHGAGIGFTAFSSSTLGCVLSEDGVPNPRGPCSGMQGQSLSSVHPTECQPRPERGGLGWPQEREVWELGLPGCQAHRTPEGQLWAGPGPLPEDTWGC